MAAPVSLAFEARAILAQVEALTFPARAGIGASTPASARVEARGGAGTDSLSARLDTDLAITSLARRLRTSGAPEEERRETAALLGRAFSLLARNSAVESAAGNLFCLNLSEPLIPPAMKCPAYRALQAPTVSCYQLVAPQTAVIRLDVRNWDKVPAEVRRMAGECDLTRTDLFYTVIRGGVAIDPPIGSGIDPHRPTNLCFHHWAYPHLEFGKDVSKDVEMGLFPLIGIHPVKDDPGAIAFHRLSPMEVHDHPHESGEMAYSPDNAHFFVDKDSPFALFWAVGKVDGRTCVSKVLVIREVPDPLNNALLEIAERSDSLFSYQTALAELDAPIVIFLNRTLRPLIIALNNNDAESANAAFEALPTWQKEGLYKQLWILKGSPMGLHNDFGKASYHHRADLAAEHHATKNDKITAIQALGKFVADELVASQLALCTPHPDKGALAERLIAIADLFSKELTEVAMEEFRALSVDDQNGVFKAIWEINDCPDRANFGGDRFGSAECSNEERAKALLLYASRC